VRDPQPTALPSSADNAACPACPINANRRAHEHLIEPVKKIQTEARARTFRGERTR